MTDGKWESLAEKYHPGYPHHEVICSYDEWLEAQSEEGLRMFWDAVDRYGKLLTALEITPI
jgi:hypothetical protein